MTDITELALITKIKKQLENFDTVILKDDEALALVEALEKAQAKITELQQGCENDPRIHEIIDLKERIAELESRTVKIPGWFVKDAIAVYDRDEIEEALSAAGIKWEAE
ncbi:hypothetical protein [Raoultella ornithinolytica]|uniref:hypothetical protein n=1 Tax=Raoultella ornithinolytica TaxID=54291 RepID=UPI0028749ECE|nr:hypothetical protein [Raoultella ornithinolytica]